MRRMLPLSLLALAVLFAGYGCSSRSAVWENRKYPGPVSTEGREQFARDRYECEKENYPMARLIHLCMESRGWFQVPPK